MKPERAHPAVTPLFRLLVPRRTDGEGVDRLSAAVSGQSRWEIRVLAAGAFALFFTMAWDLTAGIDTLCLRWPVVLGAAFLLPHFLFAAIAMMVPVGGAAPSIRQAWAFLAALTLYAALRWPGGGPGRVACGCWLALAALNLLAWPFSRER